MNAEGFPPASRDKHPHPESSNHATASTGIDNYSAKWAMAYRIAHRIVNRSLDPATGSHLIRADVAHDLGCPDDPLALVGCASTPEDWHENWGISIETLKKEAYEAAEHLLSKQPSGERTT